MKIKILTTMVVAMCSIIVLHAQDYKTQYKAENDTAGQRRVLNEWLAKSPGDAELYISLFNFYFKRATDVLALTPNAPAGQALVLTKPGEHKPVAYMGGQVNYNRAEIDKGIAYIDKGIKLFPNRLDMRFGKTYVLGVLNDYDAFTSEVVKTIDYSAVNHNQWTWTDNKPVAGDPEKQMLGSVQNYSVQLYNAGDTQIEHMKQIASAVLKYYPDNVENLSNLSICYILSKDYDKALVPLLKATAITPTDGIVLNNIAYCYQQKQDKPNAIKYYELAFKYGDERTKKQATEKLLELK